MLTNGNWDLRLGEKAALPLYRALLLAAGILTILAVAARERSDFISQIYFFKQDVPILCGMAVAFVAAAQIDFREGWLRPLRLAPRHLLMIAGAVALLCVAGTFGIMMNFDMSRDEAMATFTAASIRDGSLVAPVPAEWQPYSDALMPIFTHRLSSDSVWISGYLPLNSALQALAGAVAHPAVANPLLLFVGFYALFDAARRLWPERPDAVAVTLLLAVTSAQLIAAAMTSYAMTGHFALNMVWLALFLRRTPMADAAALLTGLVIVGLHKLHFHPLFVGPFILWLLARSEWRRALLYIGGYAAICLFWLLIYPALLLEQAGAAAAAPALADHSENEIIGVITRLLGLSPMILMANAARFAAWQNMLLLPLALLSLRLVRRNWAGQGIVHPLLLACLIGVVTMGYYQGHGWGYRYLHGLIGCFCLLAGYGWQQIVPADQPSRTWALFRYALALSAVVLIPAQLVMARNFVAPHARLYRAIKAAPADVVLLDARTGFFTEDLVQNNADPRDLPKIMDMVHLRPAALDALCATKRVVLVDERHFAAFGIAPSGLKDRNYRRVASLRAHLDRKGCAPPLRLR